MATRLVSKEYTVPFIMVTSLFFIWGFARSILDVLNKHFQEMLSISLTESALVQGMTYTGYFLMAIPAGLIITRGGYRRGIVGGLLTFGIGALLFIPGEEWMSFPVFLGALFLIGCGLAMLETSANPYATEMGDPASAAGRLNLAQSFNGLGCILGPVLVGGFLFSEEGEGHVALPYTIMGVAVLLAALAFMKLPLPTIEVTKEDALEKEEGPEAATGALRIIGKLLSSRRFMLGFAALFFYEISEISINSLFINYVTSDGWISKAIAPAVLSFCALGVFMLARVGGSLVMTRVKASVVLLVCSCGSVIATLLVSLSLGNVSHYALLAVYLFEAVMFPTVFAMTIVEAGKDVKLASSLLMMSPIGGAVGTLLMSWVAERLSLSLSFLVPMAGYLFVLIYALYKTGSDLPSGSSSILKKS
ncbi:MAG: MFS transporter [Muribaculaceae bacterium]|nr:MFS transporter [Muribaculaceae bacterium]